MNDSDATSGLTDDAAGPASSASPSPSPPPSLLEPTPPPGNRRLSLVRGQPVIRRRSRSVLDGESADSHHHRRMQSAPVFLDKAADHDDNSDKGKRRASSIMSALPPPYDVLPPYSGPGRTDDKKLREKPAPALDLLAFPQITALVLAYARGETYAPLRATCKALHARVNAMMYAHVEVKIARVDPSPPPSRTPAPPLSRLQAIVRTIQATSSFLGVTSSNLPFIPEASEGATTTPTPTPEEPVREPYFAVSIVAPRLGRASGLRPGSRIPGLRWDMGATAAHAACVKRLRAHTRVVDDGGSVSEYLDDLRRDEAAMLRLAFGSARIVRNSAGVSVLSAPTHVLFRTLNDGVYLHRHVPDRASRVVVHIDVLADSVAGLNGAVGEIMLPGPRSAGQGQREVYAVFTQTMLGISPHTGPPGMLRETIKDAIHHLGAGLRYTLVGLADLDPGLLGMSWSRSHSTDERHDIIRDGIVEYALRVAPYSRLSEYYRVGDVTREQILALFNLATREQFRAEVGNELYSLSTL
ncbi:uncharacterized protein LOC62_07G008911 [Vanrija pseudolonga]|uniref:Uncharacterized protein n=1 Tax=Vanrija pseudolonga TaxID=143232 RepID=A0AAF0YGZ4_9TREE|nr:hypothetical protein LOC62_07G008911 [Vanrija pseudolonga]